VLSGRMTVDEETHHKCHSALSTSLSEPEHVNSVTWFSNIRQCSTDDGW